MQESKKANERIREETRHHVYVHYQNPNEASLFLAFFLAKEQVYLPFRWVLSAMWLCKIGHFHSCCSSPVLNILLENP